MSITPQGIMRVINGLSGPLKTKAVKLLDKYVPKNVDAKGNVRNPLRKQSDKQGKTQKAVEGQRRYSVAEIKGAIKTLGVGGAAYAAYSAGDFINDLLGIKKMGKGTLKADGASGEYRKLSAKEAEKLKKKKVVKKTPPKTPPKKPDSVKSIPANKTEKQTRGQKSPPSKKKSQQYMTEKNTGKKSNVKFNSRGGMLKKGKK